MSRKKKTNSRGFQKDKYDWRTQVLLPLIVAVLVSALSFVSEYVIKYSAISEKCQGLESELKEKTAVIGEKNERIAEQREWITQLEVRLYSKSQELSVKENLCEYLRAMYYGREGKMLLCEDDAIQFMSITNNLTRLEDKGEKRHELEYAKKLLSKGTVIERLGLPMGLSYRDYIQNGWERPLFMGLKPGVFIPAPKGLLEQGLAIYDAVQTNDFNRAVIAAHKAYRLLSPIVDPVVNRGAEIDVRLALVVSWAYRYVAEDEFSSGNYEKAINLIGTASGVLGPKSQPRLLAIESAMLYRATNGGCGYFTKHMADAIKYADDSEDYAYQIHNELARLGYLQLYFPNKDGTDIGERIEWSNVFRGKKLHIRPTYEKNGDIWSTRWVGFDKYEEYNLSKEFRHQIKKLGIKSN